MRDPSLTATQFCGLLETVLSYRAYYYETLRYRRHDTLSCTGCCDNTNVLTYLLTYYLHNYVALNRYRLHGLPL